MKLLVAEDNLISKAAIVKTLEPYFEVIHYAANGEEALNLWTTYQHDIVVTDLNMPLMGGYELVKKIRLLEKKYTYVLVLTVESFDPVNDEHGFDDFMTKPFFPKELITRIQSGLDIMKDVRVSLEDDSGIFSTKGISSQTYLTWNLAKSFLEKLQKEAEYSDVLSDEFCGHILDAIKAYDEQKMKIVDELINCIPNASENIMDTIYLQNQIASNVLCNIKSKTAEKGVVQVIRNISLYRHEWVNGSGPYGLVKSSIPICAKIVSVLESYVKLREPYQYRIGLPMIEAERMISDLKGKRFDASIATYFLDNLSFFDDVYRTSKNYYLANQ